MCVHSHSGIGRHRSVGFAAGIAILAVLLFFLCGCTKTVTVFFDTAGGDLFGIESLTFTAGEPPRIPEPSREGYTFVSWQYPDGWEQDGGVLVAEWRQNRVSVVFDLDGGESSSPELAAQLLLPGEDAVEPPDVKKEGYIFLGWSDSFLDVSEDTVISALWEIKDIGEEEISHLCSPACLEICAYDYSDIPIALGSGFLVSGDGVAITAAHVIKGCAYIEAVPYDGEVHRVTDILYCNYEEDIAVVKTDIAGTDFLEMQSQPPDDGQKVYTIGSPSGRTGEQAEGEILRITDDYGRNMIATTLDLEGGSSGSPLLDSLGRVMGVNVAKSGVVDEALAVPAKEIPTEYPEPVTTEQFAADNRASHALMEDVSECEPNNIPERAQVAEPNLILRGEIADTGDVDCYTFENISSYRICLSIPVEYYNHTNIKLYSPDGKFSPQTWVADGISGNYKLYYAVISADKPVTVFLDVSADVGGVPYSMRGVVLG